MHKMNLVLKFLYYRLYQGPLITDGRNSSKWTEHYKDWSKTLQMVKFQGKILWNTFKWIIL